MAPGKKAYLPVTYFTKPWMYLQRIKLMAIYINPSYPNDLTMDIIEADLTWGEDDTCVFAKGTLEYEIDPANELAVFQGPKCMAIRQGKDLDHAIFIAEAFEREALRNQRNGETWMGKKGALL